MVDIVAQGTDISSEQLEKYKSISEFQQWKSGIENYLVNYEKSEHWKIYKEIEKFIPEHLKLLLFLKIIYTQFDKINQWQYKYFSKLCTNEPDKSKQLRKYLNDNNSFAFQSGYITVYRGEHGTSSTSIGKDHTKSRDVEHGLSWTYEKAVAGFFAVRTQSENCRIYTAKVSVADVLMINDTRTEAEVIIRPPCLGGKLIGLMEEKVKANISVMEKWYKYRDEENAKYDLLNGEYVDIEEGEI